MSVIMIVVDSFKIFYCRDAPYVQATLIGCKIKKKKRKEPLFKTFFEGAMAFL